MHHYCTKCSDGQRDTGEGRGEEGEGYEVRETADRGSARMGGVEDL